MSIKEEVKMPTQQHCERCGYISSNKVCKACILLEGLNKGLPKLGIGKTPKHYKIDSSGDGQASTTQSNGEGKCGNCACKSGTGAPPQQLSDRLNNVTLTHSNGVDSTTTKDIAVDKSNLDF